MGQAIKKYNWKRNDLVITTKLNWGGANGEVLINNHGLSRKHIIEGLEASLERLQLKYVDIVYAHRPDRLTPMEETVRAFNHVINNGQALCMISLPFIIMDTINLNPQTGEQANGPAMRSLKQ